MSSAANSSPGGLSWTGTSSTPELRDREFHAFRNLIHAETGIDLGPHKKEMVSARLAKRLRHLGLRSFSEYLSVLEASDQADEKREFINCLTTNKTDFFREPHHFAFLRDQFLPAFKAQAEKSGQRILRAWSAASSTGEEAYSLAMTLSEFFGPATGWDLQILASDIDSQVLDHARNAVYDEERTIPVTPELRQKYFLRGTGPNAGKVRVHPRIRSMVSFTRLNLMEEPWQIPSKFDLIFCRNVIIYFNRETQARLMRRLAQHLSPEGYLFLGHSENLHWLTELYVHRGETIYQLRDARSAPRAAIDSTAPAARQVSDFERGTRPAPRTALPEKTLIVGDVCASNQPILLKTLLGSCVSACLYDPDTGVGGMNHFSLPGGTAEDGACTRYGIHAMELLINEIMKHGGDRRRLRAKIFGGSHVLRVGDINSDIGTRNVEFVKQFLETEQIPVINHCLGGESGLRIRFQPHDGRAFVKPLDGQALRSIATEEQKFASDVGRTLQRPQTEAVVLF